MRKAVLCAALAAVCFVAPALAGVTPYPAPVGDESNPQYSVTVDGTPVDSVMTIMHVGYAHFAFDGTVEVKVKASEPIETFNLSPHRLNIDAKAEGDTLTFTIDKPCKLHLTVNGLSRFFIFADPPEVDAPKPGDPGVISLADLGVESSTELVQTQKLQEAFNRVAAEKGTLYVPAGYYKAGQLDLPSNLTLYLAPGAMIRGTARPDDYPPRGEPAQLLMTDARNVRLYGRGVIDNNGYGLRTFLGTKDNTTRVVKTVRSSHLVMEDLIVRDPSVWTIVPIESNDMTFRNLKIIAMSRNEQEDKTRGFNTDGFDPDNSSNILMENNFLSIDDDPLAIKLTRGNLRDVSNIVFRNNVIFNMTSALKLGTEIRGGKTVSDVLIEGNDVIHCDKGISLYCGRGGYARNIRWINNHFEQVGQLPNESRGSNKALIAITAVQDSFGHIRDVLIKDNTFEGFSPRNSFVRAKGPDNTIENVVIENLVVAGKKIMSAEEGRIDVSPDVKGLEFR